MAIYTADISWKSVSGEVSEAGEEMHAGLTGGTSIGSGCGSAFASGYPEDQGENRCSDE